MFSITWAVICPGRSLRNVGHLPWRAIDLIERARGKGIDLHRIDVAIHEPANTLPLGRTMPSMASLRAHRQVMVCFCSKY